MVKFTDLITRKFQNIAGSRYEEILKAYEEFFLTEEEMVIPDIKSILIPLDRYTTTVPDEVYETISAYPNARLQLVYMIDENVCRLIKDTLGEEDAKKFREKEERRAREILSRMRDRIRELGIIWAEDTVFGDKSEYVESIAGEYDMLIISKHYGSETAKTHTVSPVVFRIVQYVGRPVVLY
ncbi:universal stress protein [Thermococcus sp.]|uniref:universal stress protein n=1 Tax=Thermococcus sp. TaxID=35749 RepID=UPI00262EA41D|nr:universal stress protein [Thermococcus sp.]